MNSPIKKGDRVRIEWEHLEPIEGIVKFMPCYPGDDWVIEAKALPIYGIYARTMHIQQYSRITKLSE
jgi:hypothetical protein